ncbi:hypothetical protein CRV15_34670 (plasmid) [Streptomyces clavuligerus]|uniref:Uncharacterized protein n=1 Tax=Streptomyces clavuligerus TaxID=1901 RepID=B5H1D7_STRCL|nr:hypothetical protein SSCG_05411 [Streptomyces clavuligerus]EFG04830.1 Hypothetical protein SCLAV_p1346 [Streptomyces clavuligerus]QCS10668.1 hypothetical protein CRV15_34670 [Streptomyces clavuligerus]QPJ97295.1 hypothetical protein GE265_29805 [Streptomyces clavuligerus]
MPEAYTDERADHADRSRHAAPTAVGSAPGPGGFGVRPGALRGTPGGRPYAGPVPGRSAAVMG